MTKQKHITSQILKVVGTITIALIIATKVNDTGLKNLTIVTKHRRDAMKRLRLAQNAVALCAVRSS